MWKCHTRSATIFVVKFLEDKASSCLCMKNAQCEGPRWVLRHGRPAPGDDDHPFIPFRPRRPRMGLSLTPIDRIHLIASSFRRSTVLGHSTLRWRLSKSR